MVKVILYSTLILWAILTSGCQPPYKPDYDMGFGKLIFKGTCQNQTTYLMDIVYLNAYKSGYGYNDTLTVNGVKYAHVIQLDSSQAAFLAGKQPNDKISIDFERAGPTQFPRCMGVSSATIELVKVRSIGNTDY